MEFAITFLRLFLFGLYLAAPLLLSLLLVIVVVGQCVGRKEKWSRFDSLYWSFVTATTLGYGDFRPSQKSSKLFAIFITLNGIVLTGIIVAVALYSATEAFKAHKDIETVKSGIHRITD